jgi:membrane protein
VRIKSQQIRTTRELYSFWKKRFSKAQLNQVAASLAYTTILALVPMFSIATILVSKLSSFIKVRVAIQEWIALTLIPGGLSDKITTYLLNFSNHSKGLTTFGVGGLIITAFLTLMTIERSFNQVWQVEKPRPLFRRIVIYLSVTIFGPVLLGLSVYTTTQLIDVSRSLHLGIGFDHHYYVVEWLVPFLLTLLPFTLLYKFGPSAQVDWRDALLGSVLAAIVFETAKYGFTLFISKAPLYKTLYGAFAIGPLFLVWIYLTWWVTLAGAVLTASLPLIRENHWFTDI